MKIGLANSKFVMSNLRFDGKFHLSEGLEVRKLIKQSPYGYELIRNVTSDIYCPGIFRRNYTSSGIPFLGGGDIQKADYNSGKYLRANTTPNHEVLEIKKGWSLVTCGGTIGDTVFANNLLAKCWVSQHVMRVIPSTIKEGMLFSYLASKYGYSLLTTNTYGAVIPTLNSSNIAELPIPKFPDEFQKEVDDLIQKSATFYEKSNKLINDSQFILKEETGLPSLNEEDYNYFGPKSYHRRVSTFVRNISDLGSLSFHAFNYSDRVKKCIIDRVNEINHITLYDALDSKKLHSPSGVSVTEVKDGHGIMLINQSDIFDRIVKGKWVVKKEKYTKDLLRRNEILIAKIGTLGENETFCRCVFVGEALEGQLISSAFYRMNTCSEIPSGYLYAWLSSEYGFRLIRSSQYGTKQCYPNPSILYKYPVPIINEDKMKLIDSFVKESCHLSYLANQMELKAIRMVEEEIEKWNN